MYKGKKGLLVSKDGHIWGVHGIINANYSFFPSGVQNPSSLQHKNLHSKQYRIGEPKPGSFFLLGSISCRCVSSGNSCLFFKKGLFPGLVLRRQLQSG
jgi:hypothetical protein